MGKRTDISYDVLPQSYGDRWEKLPLLISVPHGGYTIPSDLAPRLALDFKDIYLDSDTCTRTIYAFGKQVRHYQDTAIARVVVDLNRAEDALPPRCRDGVIKSHTVAGKAVFRPGRQPDDRLMRELLGRYYYPYHRHLSKKMCDHKVLCGMDCHSMLDFLPGHEHIEADRRPFICLSNGGDEHGRGRNLSCPAELLQLLAGCLRRAFPSEARDIILNHPFTGGNITRTHGREMPWIQIEINRRAYLAAPWFDLQTLRVDMARLQELRRRVLQALIDFCAEAGGRSSGLVADQLHNCSWSYRTKIEGVPEK